MPIYFDHNATTPLASEVMEAMQPYMSGVYGNPSSVHRYGRMMRDALEQARAQVARFAGAEVNQVVFTSGGTEANNLAIKGSMAQFDAGHIAVSSIEHACVIEPVRELQAAGWQLDLMAVDSQGQLAESTLSQAIGSQTKLVSVMAANNETGVLQNMPALVKAAKAVNPQLLFHSDLCQLAGKLPFSFSQYELDMMTLSSHKLYGPQGAGALIVSRKIDLQAQITGGGQESGRRSGTENMAAIIGFGKAAELAQLKQLQRQQHTQVLRKRLLEALVSMAGVNVFSANVECLPNTLQFSVQGIDGETLLMQLDKKGFAVSSGSACHSEHTEPSHVLIAMKVDAVIAKGAIRVSFGEQNTVEQVDEFINALVQIRQQFN